MSQLTQQIAAAYIGAQVLWRGIEVPAYNIINAHEIINCRLILTPVPYMKEEDACYLVGQNPAQLGGLLYAELIRGRSELLLDFTRSRHTVKLDIPTIDYLRSDKRPDGTSKPVYDLGYMHIRSLIDAGIAISSTDKTDSNVQP